MARVLLIESDRLLGASTQQALKRAGHRVNLQVDPQAAVDGADGARPDVIIMDLQFAGRSGVEFLYEFRSYPDWANVPVVVYSGLSLEELEQARRGFSQLNVAGFYSKSIVSLAQLTRAVDRLLQPAKA